MSEGLNVQSKRRLLLFFSGFVAASTLYLLNELRRTFVTKKRRRTVVGVIPARYESSRFPGKPLVDILGKPMIVRTYEQACRSKLLSMVVVATDDDRIQAACQQRGIPVIMTDPNCPNGTVRCYEAVGQLPASYDVVVNIQGDEPLIAPEAIDAVAQALLDCPEAVYSTAVSPLSVDEVAHTSRVKCIRDVNGFALYFSRGILPSNKSGHPRPFPPPFDQQPYYLHLGLYAYDAAFLATYCALPPTPLMLMEDLEQLKVLEHGYKMKVVVVEEGAHGVDVPEDVAVLENMIQTRGMH